MVYVNEFKACYAANLAVLVSAKPQEYGFPVSQVHAVVDKMFEGMKRGSAEFGPAARKALRMCGCVGTKRRDYIEFVNSLEINPHELDCLCVSCQRGKSVLPASRSSREQTPQEKANLFGRDVEKITRSDYAMSIADWQAVRDYAKMIELVAAVVVEGSGQGQSQPAEKPCASAPA
jgi:hypothetical protein